MHTSARLQPTAEENRSPSEALLTGGRGSALEGGHGFRIGDLGARALPCGALFFPLGRVLVVSDLHLEKGSSLARRGRLAPPYDTSATLARLALVIARTDPSVVISLGDSFHDRGGPSRLTLPDRARLTALMAGRDWVWVDGNHDGDCAAALGGRSTAEFRFGRLVFRHEPSAAAKGVEVEVSGHLHPCARVVAGGGSVRRKCFAVSPERVVMPAYGAYTGGLNVLDRAFGPLFRFGCDALVLGKTRVFGIPRARLRSD